MHKEEKERSMGLSDEERSFCAEVGSSLELKIMAEQAHGMIYLLYYKEEDTKLKIMPFPTFEKLQERVVDLVKKCEKIDKDWLPSLEFLFKDDNFKKNWKLFKTTFRDIWLENSQSLGFDLYWEDPVEASPRS